MRWQKILFLMLLLGFFIPCVSFSISLEKNDYKADERVLFNSTGGPWSVFDRKSGSFVGTGSSYSVEDDISAVLDNKNSNYSVVETREDDNCGDLDYLECKASTDFVGEFLFTVGYTVSAGSGTIPENLGGGGPVAYRPEVAIYSPVDTRTYGTMIDIIYEATDKNDKEGLGYLGLGSTPVTIYYSKTSDIRQKVQLATNLPAKGIFKWDTKELPGGNTYNIIIDATDKVNETGEAVSGSFSIDHTAPVFTVKTDPAVSQGEDVKIVIDSSKELSASPVVRVTQNNFNSFDVPVLGSGKHFEGLYRVIKGYNGPAEITVLGKDLAGNESNVIVFGGQFNVGNDFPTMPVVTSPKNNEVILNGVTDVKGKVEKGNEVILSVNGKDKYKTTSNEEGEFLFSKINLKTDFNYGLNFLNLVSRDFSWNISEPANITLKCNIIPELFIDYPVSGQKLPLVTEISIKSSDKNNDKLLFDYEVSGDNGATWKYLVTGVEDKKYSWDTSTFSDGEYSIRVTANDGTTKKKFVTDNLVIKNYLPFFSFNDGDSTSIGKEEYLVSGTVKSSEKLPSRLRITAVDYSLDNGKKWIPVNYRTLDVQNDSEVGFSIAIKTAEQKKYSVLFRAKDSRGVYGKGVKTIAVVFDKTITPVISSLKNGEIISDSQDEDKNVAGLQITVFGSSTPDSLVSVKNGENIFSGRTNFLGFFSIPGVTMKERGKNTLSASAISDSGEKSSVSDMDVIYNNPPVLYFINPRDGKGLNHNSIVSFSAYDLDGDELKNTTLSYKKPGDSVFKQLDSNPLNNKFEFNVSDFKEGCGYQLKLESGDGILNTSRVVDFCVDNTPPEILLNPVKKNNFKKEFTFEASGSASDGQMGVEFLEYSFDGEHWFKATLDSRPAKNKVNFKIKYPFALDDGDYKIRVRSVDYAGNISKILTEEIIVDTMPPRLGSFDLSLNGISLYPEDDVFKISKGSNVNFIASFENKTKSASVVIGKRAIKLNKESSDGLWRTKFSLDDVGIFPIKFNAIDDFNNLVEGKKIGTIEVIEEGRVTLNNSSSTPESFVSGADMTIMQYDEVSRSFVKWNGLKYSSINPVKTDGTGSYNLLLPSGKYNIMIRKNGLVNLDTNDFELKNPKFLDTTFNMKKRVGAKGFFEDILSKFIIF